MTTMILVPEGLVSLLIGTKGRMINKMKEESNSDIVVNQPVYGMKTRSVKIEGKIPQILRGVFQVYDTIEGQAHAFNDIEKKKVSY
jgi:hypothetical protein